MSFSVHESPYNFPVIVEKPFPLILAFIGFDEAQTRRYFAEFANVNADQVLDFDDLRGCIRLRDGTLIQRVPNNPFHVMGHHYDQIIVADAGRRVHKWPMRRWELLFELCNRLSGFLVSEQALIYYDLDSEVDER